MKNDLFTVEFSFPQTSNNIVRCPNCGLKIYNGLTLVSKDTLSKSIVLLGCGTFLYFHIFRYDQLRTFLEEFGDKVQSYAATIYDYFARHSPPQEASPKTAKVYDIQNSMLSNQLNNCSVTNQIIYVEKKPQPKTVDLTFDKIDNLLEQVRELKETVQEFSRQDLSFDRPANFRLERRLSENDLPSLEWDLEDALQNDDTSSIYAPLNESDPLSPQLYHLEYNGIDAETLSKIVFNKNFDFKERLCELGNSNQQNETLASIRQRLLRSQILHRTLRRNVPQMNALMDPPPFRMYKSCMRDSAYFED